MPEAAPSSNDGMPSQSTMLLGSPSTLDDLGAQWQAGSRTGITADLEAALVGVEDNDEDDGSDLLLATKKRTAPPVATRGSGAPVSISPAFDAMRVTSVDPLELMQEAVFEASGMGPTLSAAQLQAVDEAERRVANKHLSGLVQLASGEVIHIEKDEDPPGAGDDAVSVDGALYAPAATASPTAGPTSAGRSAGNRCSKHTPASADALNVPAKPATAGTPATVAAPAPTLANTTAARTNAADPPGRPSVDPAQVSAAAAALPTSAATTAAGSAAATGHPAGIHCPNHTPAPASVPNGPVKHACAAALPTPWTRMGESSDSLWRPATKRRNYVTPVSAATAAPRPPGEGAAPVGTAPPVAAPTARAGAPSPSTRPAAAAAAAPSAEAHEHPAVGSHCFLTQRVCADENGSAAALPAANEANVPAAPAAAGTTTRGSSAPAPHRDAATATTTPDRHATPRTAAPSALWSGPAHNGHPHLPPLPSRTTAARGRCQTRGDVAAARDGGEVSEGAPAAKRALRRVPSSGAATRPASGAPLSAEGAGASTTAVPPVSVAAATTAPPPGADDDVTARSLDSSAQSDAAGKRRRC